MTEKFCKNCIHIRKNHIETLCTSPKSKGVVTDYVNGNRDHCHLAFRNRDKCGDCKPEGILFERRIGLLEKLFGGVKHERNF